MALNKIAHYIAERHIVALALLFGYLISFLDSRAQITGSIAFMREKFPLWFIDSIAIYLACSIIYLLLRKVKPLSLFICLLPQFFYTMVATWWLVESRSDAVPAPITAFGVHFGFSILAFGMVLLRLRAMAKGYSLDDTILPTRPN